MDKILVDSNIVFSAILNINSRTGQIILNNNDYYEFYSPEYVRYEVLKYQDKIKAIANFTDDEFIATYELIIRKISILNHSIIPLKFYKKAADLCKTIDIDDTVFVAFAEYIHGKLWTGDKPLINGLREKGFKRLITTEELYKDFMRKAKPKK